MHTGHQDIQLLNLQLLDAVLPQVMVLALYALIRLLLQPELYPLLVTGHLLT